MIMKQQNIMPRISYQLDNKHEKKKQYTVKKKNNVNYHLTFQQFDKYYMKEDMKEHKKGFVEQTKEQLFTLLNNVLEESEIGLPRLIITHILSFLILVAFSFHDKIDFNWEPSELYSNFLKWFNILRIVFIAEKTNSIMLLVFFFSSCGFILFCWLLFFFGIRSAAYGTVPHFISSVIRVLMAIFPGILYLEMIDVTTSIFKCVDTSSGSVVEITSEFSSPIYCWDTSHIIYLCLACIFLILHISFAFFVVMFDLEMKMDSKNYTTRATNTLEIFGLVQRSLVVFIILIFGFDSKKIIGFSFILLSTIKLLMSMTAEPYHKKGAQILILSLNAVETWINISLCIDIFFSWIEFSMNSLLAILGAPVFAVMIVYVWLEKNTGLLQLKSKNSSSYDLYLKMRKLIEIYEHSEDMENAVWLNGLLSRHVQKCKKEACPFHEEFKKILNSNIVSIAESGKILLCEIVHTTSHRDF